MGSGCPRPSKLSSGHSLERTSVPVVALCRGFPWCLEYCCTSNGNWHLGVSDVRALRWLLRQSVSDEYSRRYSTYLGSYLKANSRYARSKNLANIYYNYLQFFPILSVVFRGETHSTRNTPRGCTELLMVPTRNHLLFWGHCVVECKFQ